MKLLSVAAPESPFVCVCVCGGGGGGNNIWPKVTIVL